MSSTTNTNSDQMHSVLQESRKFPPPAELVAKAHVSSPEQYEKMYKRSIEDPEGFWGEVAKDLHWFKPWDKVLEWKCPDAKWFVGGKMNISYNCLDRQVKAGFGDKTAIIWESEGVDAAGKPTIINLTYADLLKKVSTFANALKKLGVKKGDVVTIYLPMIPELAIAMLACTRIGAPHSVIFGGFSAQAIRDRVDNCKSKILITADGGWRRGKPVPLKANADEGMTLTDKIKTCVVVKHAANKVDMKQGRDLWWDDVIKGVSDECAPEPMDAEDLAFILYTSGSTGKPKGIMHTTGGYSVYTYYTAKISFDLKPEENDVFWCTADIGWITGHSYIIYGMLPNRVPSIMYEGGPNWPAEDRFWDVIERHQVTKFYTAPTAIRTFMKWGDAHIDKHDISSLKILGTVGEPINPEAWMWYHEKIGKGRCPIIDSWWQTETGGHMIVPKPGVTITTPGSCTTPFFGIDAAVVNSEGEEVPTNTGGILVIRKPWPAMLRGVFGDRDRYIDTYWSKVPNMYTAGDGARKDEDGNFWIMGRIDDVIVVAGHNLGTMEVESALVSHPSVAEAAVVGYPHDIKGTGVAAFVILRIPIPVGEAAEKLKTELSKHVAKELGPIAKPDVIKLTDALPKTRSGKIMRRLLRDIAAGVEVKGDITTLEDKSIIEKLQKG